MAQNQPYPKLEERIAKTYAAASKAGLTNHYMMLILKHFVGQLTVWIMMVA